MTVMRASSFKAEEHQEAICTLVDLDIAFVTIKIVTDFATCF